MLLFFLPSPGGEKLLQRASSNATGNHLCS
jgi:hypothetical protein